MVATSLDYDHFLACFRIRRTNDIHRYFTPSVVLLIWNKGNGNSKVETRSRKKAYFAASNAGAGQVIAMPSRTQTHLGKQHNGVFYNFGAAFPVDVETYGVGLLLLSTAFIWIIITTCIAFLFLGNFSSFGMLYFAFTGAAVVSVFTGFAATVFRNENGSIFVAVAALLMVLLVYSGYLSLDLYLLCSKFINKFDFAVANIVKGSFAYKLYSATAPVF